MKWIVAVLMLVHYRTALQRKVLGTIGLDTLLTASFTISLLPAAVHAAASVANWKSSIIFLLWDASSLSIIFLTCAYNLVTHYLSKHLNIKSVI